MTKLDVYRRELAELALADTMKYLGNRDYEEFSESFFDVPLSWAKNLFTKELEAVPGVLFDVVKDALDRFLDELKRIPELDRQDILATVYEDDFPAQKYPSFAAVTAFTSKVLMVKAEVASAGFLDKDVAGFLSKLTTEMEEMFDQHPLYSDRRYHHRFFTVENGVADQSCFAVDDFLECAKAVLFILIVLPYAREETPTLKKLDAYADILEGYFSLRHNLQVEKLTTV